jgi:hypothetical protein
VRREYHTDVPEPPMFVFTLEEAETRLLAQGKVPKYVQAQATRMIDWNLETAGQRRRR